MKVLNDHTGIPKLREYCNLANEGATLALISDAGTPVVSDPGAEFVSLCVGAGVAVDAIPGPSAVSLGLSLSGFFAQRYAFLGFLGRKRSQSVETLEPFAQSSLTLVLFESPHRLEATLAACGEALGERNYVICRELTKMHQQIYRGQLPEVPDSTLVPRKGEITIVVEGHRRNQSL